MKLAGPILAGRPLPKTARIVMKYGGTSVGSPERIQNIAARTKRWYDMGYRNLAVVVSAMSGETNKLVALVKSVNPDASARSYDMAVSAGEQISVGLTSAALERFGLKAEPLMGLQLGIVTDQVHSKARIKAIDTSRIKAAWQAGGIPVIAGFQGRTEDDDITTLGRGGSDTSAVAVAVALEAEMCEINTDVDGVYTCDPRIVPEARLIPRMDYETALEMASLGSKVLHPRCVELAAKFSIPVIVRNTFTADDHQRTEVMALTSREEMESPVVSGVTLDRDVVKVVLDCVPTSSEALARVFASVAERNINVDIISFDHASSIGFTVSEGDAAAVEQTVKDLKSLKGFEGMSSKLERGFVKVSAVGVGMRSHAGVASRAFQALAKAGVEIQMIATSEIKISCVVHAGAADAASKALHSAFI